MLSGGSTRMSILAWIVIGLLAGWIASMIMHGGYGIIGDLVLGILGALIGGWVTGLEHLSLNVVATERGSGREFAARVDHPVGGNGRSFSTGGRPDPSRRARRS